MRTVLEKRSSPPHNSNCFHDIYWTKNWWRDAITRIARRIVRYDAASCAIIVARSSERVNEIRVSLFQSRGEISQFVVFLAAVIPAGVVARCLRTLPRFYRQCSIDSEKKRSRPLEGRQSQFPAFKVAVCCTLSSAGLKPLLYAVYRVNVAQCLLICHTRAIFTVFVTQHAVTISKMINFLEIYQETKLLGLSSTWIFFIPSLNFV